MFQKKKHRRTDDISANLVFNRFCANEKAFGKARD
jgi:hypothetical protein